MGTDQGRHAECDTFCNDLPDSGTEQIFSAVFLQKGDGRHFSQEGKGFLTVPSVYHVFDSQGLCMQRGCDFAMQTVFPTEVAEAEQCGKFFFGQSRNKDGFFLFLIRPVRFYPVGAVQNQMSV